MQVHAESVARLVTPPIPGQLVEIAEGLRWTQFPLPFALKFVNVFLLEDDGGYAVVDTGIADDETRRLWRTLLGGPLRGKTITKLILTHHHPDHMGMAGWLTGELDVPLYMTEAEYLFSQHLRNNAQAVDEDGYRQFYRRHGMPVEHADVIIGQGQRYRRNSTGLPWTYHQLVHGDRLSIGGRTWDIHTGGGHSSDQAMLHCRADGLFLAADQVLPAITPNISVLAINPEADPLGLFLRSLAEIKAAIPDDVLAIPGHRQPFTNLHARIDEIAWHHETRCRIVETACNENPLTAAEVRPLLFRPTADPLTLTLAFSETLAHMNMMGRAGRLHWGMDGDVLRASAA